MANEIFAFVPSQRIPTRGEWQHALDTLEMGGNTLTLSESLVVDRARGFCPMVLTGIATGVEVYADSPPILDFDTMIKEIPVLAGRVTPDHTALSFRFGGKPLEVCCAYAATAALVSGFGAVVYDEPEGKVYADPGRLVAVMRMQLLWIDYGFDKEPTPDFLRELERLNGGPFRSVVGVEIYVDGVKVDMADRKPVPAYGTPEWDNYMQEVKERVDKKLGPPSGRLTITRVPSKPFQP